MTYEYKTKGTCSSRITFDLDGDVVKNVKFTGGCNGNLKGISALIEGRPALEVIDTLQGITCGPRPTSCPDQLARALKLYLDQEK